MTINFNKEFKKRYQSLPPKTKIQVLERIELFKADPRHPRLRQHPLKGKLAAYSTINISGDLRAVFRKEGQVITFVLIGSHAQLY